MCENKRVWSGRVFTFEYIQQTLMSCGSCPPVFLLPRARLTNLLTGTGWSWRTWPGNKTQQSQPTRTRTITMVSTSKHGQEPVLCMQPSQVLTLAGVVSGCLTRMLPAAVANIEGSKDRRPY